MFFVLMESDYGMNTAPEKVDGWILDIMKENGILSPAYPLWLSSQVKSASSAIVEFSGLSVSLHNEIKGSIERASLVAASLHKTTLATVLGVSDEQMSQYTTAWNIIQSSSNVLDYSMMLSHLDEIGVFEAVDLRQCDKDDINVLTKLLKKIQQKKFIQCMSFR